MHYYCVIEARGTNMDEMYSVIIEYYSGRRKGHKITIKGIDQDDIMNILGEITQDQLANAEVIVVNQANQIMFYEDFIIESYQESKKIPISNKN